MFLTRIITDAKSFEGAREEEVWNYKVKYSKVGSRKEKSNVGEQEEGAEKGSWN